MATPTHKLAHYDQSTIKAAALQALIAADPNYFSWPEEQQEKFRANMPTLARQKAERVLLSKLFNINCSVEQVDVMLDDIKGSKRDILNWAKLLITGIGNDYLYLNEYMPENQSLLDFNTLYDYDYDNYLYRVAVNKKEFPEQDTPDYIAMQFPIWVRLLINDEFHYSTLLSVATHFGFEVEKAGNDFIETLIPHSYVEGKDNGKDVEGGVIWDMVIDANGMEAQLEELQSRWITYQQQLQLELVEKTKAAPETIYQKFDYSDGDPHCSFIFPNTATIKRVRWKHFLDDCQPVLADAKCLDNDLVSIIQEAKIWLQQTHHKIINNFDPTVVKFKKKNKIILSFGALDDLDNLHDLEDDEDF